MMMPTSVVAGLPIADSPFQRFIHVRVLRAKPRTLDPVVKVWWALLCAETALLGR